MKALRMQTAKYAAIFAVGAILYGAVEIVYRGHTHWTMVLCGGTCLAIFFAINTVLSGDSLWKRCFVGCALITALEFIVGCIVNLWLKLNVWDYSARFANVFGQICPAFCLGWYLLSIPAFKLCDYIGKVGFLDMKKKYYGKMDEETVRELAKVSKKMFSGKDGKKRFLIALVVIICALSAMLIFSEDARNYVFNNAEFVSKQSVDGMLEVHFIDVGQGDSELIIADDGSTMLIDAGPNSSEESLLRYLKTNNIEKLDVVVFTHPHEDHIGGGDYILNNIPADKVIMPDATANTATFERLLDAIDKAGADVQIAQSGDTFNLGSATVKILAPNSEKYDSLNDYSVVLHLTFGETSFMFTGDAEKKSEYEILAKYSESELKSDVLKLGHHGSSTSNSDAFLAAVDPTVAVAECGVDNDYGHPHREIVKALEKLDIKFFRTDKDGSVIILSDGKNIVSSK